MSVNRLGSFIGFSHAGMTAEGDNAVLMQKVAKELLAGLDSGDRPIKLIAKKTLQSPNLNSLKDLMNLFKYRETSQLIQVHYVIYDLKYYLSL